MTLLSEAYDRNAFLTFVKSFIPTFEEDVRPVEFTNRAFMETVYLGRSKELRVPIYEVTLLGGFAARVSITKASFRLMKYLQDYKALIVFRSDGMRDWRFSYVTIQPVIVEGKIAEEFSNPRRFSYLLGPESKIATALKFLIKKGAVTDIPDLESRFSVEVVNDEFYQEIARLFDQLVGLGNSGGDLVHPGSMEIRHQYAVRMIGRILFCWFLREKHDAGGVPLVSKELLSRAGVSRTSCYLEETLNLLFFEALNTPMDQRKELNPQFRITPYLNGGLFSPRLDDHYAYGGAPKNRPVTIANSWFLDFFELLETYNFTVDENSSVDIELSIDPEMLGRIFENLLARLDPITGETIRALTGSFYTPRYIVDRIVDTALMTFLQRKSGIPMEKIRALFTYDLSDDLIYPLEEAQREILVRLVSEVTVIDPACGSGAFPMGALQRILFILRQLDPEAKIWLANQFKNLSPEIRKIVEKEIKAENYDYVRKLTAIRSNIFGVDIQPIAAEIAKLRCFLTLVVEQDVHSDEPNRGVHILPNLEFKFVTANTLLPLHASEGLFGDELELIDQIQAIRTEYFATDSPRKKEALHEKFVKLISDQKTSLWESSRLEQLKSFRPFDSESSALFFDPEFMFGVQHFDLVIGNPPYIDSELMVKTMEDYRKHLKKLYRSALGNWDIFVLFLEKGIDLISPGGVMSMIVKNQLLGASYSAEIRRIIRENRVDEILDFSEVNVFKSASVYPVVIQVSKVRERVPVKIEIFGEGEEDCHRLEIEKERFYESEAWGSFFSSLEIQNFILGFPRSSRLASLNFVREVAAAATTAEAYEFKEVVREFDPKHDKEGKFRKFINTGTIDPFVSMWGIKDTRYLKSDFLRPIIRDRDISKISDRRLEQARHPKVILAGMSIGLEAFLDVDGSYIPGKSTSFVSIDGPEDLPMLKFLCALLNSELIAFWFSGTFTGLKMAGGYLRIGPKEIRQIPIVSPSKTQLESIVKLVDKMLDGSTQVESRISLNRKLNDKILSLYGVTSTQWSEIKRSAG